MFLDTCHSAGAISQTVTVPSSISRQTLDRIFEGTGRAIIAASQVDESSYEQVRYGHGLFTYYLLQGLPDQKDAPIDKLYEWGERPRGAGCGAEQLEAASNVQRERHWKARL
ncbi:MAG TPA: hypothetical protein VKB88_03930 [Bryobacteraceae bacterium]|nr:hypothetical protein [Bryobacteraceae bacterium]